MKNISLRFTFAACGIVVIYGLVAGGGKYMGLAPLLLPVAIVTTLLSFRLNRVIAHVLNLLPVALVLPIVFAGGHDIEYLVMTVAFVASPLLLLGFISLWCFAWSVRGTGEMELVETHLPGRRAPLVLPQPSAEDRLKMKKPSNPRNP
ncbi:MAG: hypothetical protein KF712_00480 [Akkermansiaceae bacterium]|nr:hypothetical protein [Akkermansiaceae bacterium]